MIKPGKYNYYPGLVVLLIHYYPIVKMNEPEKRTTPLTEKEKRSLDHLERMINIPQEREEWDYEMGEVDVDQDGH